MNSSWKILFIRNGILTGFMLAFVYHFLFMAQTVGAKYPYNSFLFRPGDRFNDFFNIYVFNFGPYLPRQDWGGFPLNFMLCSLFTVMQPLIAVWTYLVSCTLASIAYMRYTIGKLPHLSTISESTILLLFSYPFIMMIDRANTDYFILMFLFGFDIFLRRKSYLVSSICLGLAMAVKPFSVVYIILFIKEKQYISAGYTIFTFVMATVICLLTFNGDFIGNFDQWITNLRAYQQAYPYGYEGTIYSCSAFAMLKYYLVSQDSTIFDKDTIRELGRIYFFASTAIYLLVAALVYFKSKSYWKDLALLTVCSTLLPHCCGDYRLVYFLLPLANYLRQSNDQAEFRWLDVIYCLCFIILFIPKHYYFLLAEISISQVISPLTLATMLIFLTYDVLCLPGKAAPDTALKETKSP